MRKWKPNIVHDSIDLELISALPDPDKLELLADFFDRYDSLIGHINNDVQTDLRTWANKIRTVLSKI